MLIQKSSNPLGCTLGTCAEHFPEAIGYWDHEVEQGALKLVGDTNI